jgi:hypothetical protein
VITVALGPNIAGIVAAPTVRLKADTTSPRSA